MKAKTPMTDAEVNARIDRRLARVARWLNKRAARGHPKTRIGDFYERVFILRDARALVNEISGDEFSRALARRMAERGVVVER